MRRAATYDNQIRRWIKDDVVCSELTDEDANMAELGRRLLDKKCVWLCHGPPVLLRSVVEAAWQPHQQWACVAHKHICLSSCSLAALSVPLMLPALCTSHDSAAGLRRSELPSFEPVDITLDLLLAEGHRLAGEQAAVNALKLSEEYMRDTGGGGSSLVGLKG